jgi:hypothetical protein
VHRAGQVGGLPRPPLSCQRLLRGARGGRGAPVGQDLLPEQRAAGRGRRQAQSAPQRHLSRAGASQASMQPRGQGAAAQRAGARQGPRLPLPGASTSPCSASTTTVPRSQMCTPGAGASSSPAILVMTSAGTRQAAGLAAFLRSAASCRRGGEGAPGATVRHARRAVTPRRRHMSARAARRWAGGLPRRPPPPNTQTHTPLGNCSTLECRRRRLHAAAQMRGIAI